MIAAAPIAISVSPARIALAAPASRAIELRNLGAERVIVDVTRTSVDGRGPARGWLRIRPDHLVLRSGSSSVLTLRARGGSGAGPGDHQLRLFFVARPAGAGRITVRVRLGVAVRVRIPGRTFRRLEVRGLQVRRHRAARVFMVALANTGNVTEQLRGRLTVTLTRRGRLLSRLRHRSARELYPGKRAVVALPYRGGVRGPVTAVVQVRLGSHARPVVRSYRVRL